MSVIKIVNLSHPRANWSSKALAMVPTQATHRHLVSRGVFEAKLQIPIPCNCVAEACMCRWLAL